MFGSRRTDHDAHNPQGLFESEIAVLAGEHPLELFTFPPIIQTESVLAFQILNLLLVDLL